MQYLIRTIEHNGEPFTDVITVRDNEMYQVVEAESKEEAKRLYREVQMRNAFNILNKGIRNMREAMRKDSENNE